MNINKAMKRSIIQTASQTFIQCLSAFDLRGDEIVILEFDDHNETIFADRIILQSTGELLYGQLELPLNIPPTPERPDLLNALERIKQASDKVKTTWNTNNKIIRR